MSRFCPLFSSSSGNSVYIGTRADGILVDAGVSAKRISNALCDIDVSPDTIRAIFITHEHIDHVKGLCVFASRHGIPVFASNGTLLALSAGGYVNNSINTFSVDFAGTEAAGMLVTPFHTSHDCADPLGYTVQMPDGRKIAVATDTGVVTPEILTAVTGCDLVYIESNHDVAMLKSGAYPYALKKRILSEYGHLSNDACADTLTALVGKGTSRFVLAHLSRENNHPAIAYETAETALREFGAKLGRDCLLSVAKPENDAEVTVF